MAARVECRQKAVNKKNDIKITQKRGSHFDHRYGPRDPKGANQHLAAKLALGLFA